MNFGALVPIFGVLVPMLGSLSSFWGLCGVPIMVFGVSELILGSM